jgi:small-conductance mechanosensitive channel
MRILQISLAVTLVLGFITGLVMAMMYSTKIAIAVPIVTFGLTFALQRYIACFFAYFDILISGIYRPGDRIRIGEIKGDVRWVGLIHTTLAEVGEDEKLGGELTGRIMHLPNLVVLDQAVLNYSKDYSARQKRIASDYMFDEARIPVSRDSNVNKATELLEGILRSEDAVYLEQVREVFRDGYPQFLEEAVSGPRVLIHVEPNCIWIKGKFVAPVRQRNQLKSRILTQFLRQVKATSNVRLPSAAPPPTSAASTASATA